MKVRGANRESKAFWLAVVGGLILFAAALRIVALDEQGLWHDELYSVAHLSGFDAYVLPSSDLNPVEPPRPVSEWLEEVKQDRYWETLDRNLVHEGHPPLYQLGLKLWTSLLGQSIETVRSFSLIPALLIIPILFLVGLRFHGPRIGTAAALLITISPFHLYYSVEARNYTWSLLFSAVALLAIVDIWQNQEPGSRQKFILWWVAVVGASYSHYYAGLYCAVLMILVLVLRRQSLGFAVKLGLPFLFFLPWFPVLKAQIDIHSAEHWTVGAPDILEASTGFVRILLDQLTGVFASATTIERTLGAIALLAGVSLIGRASLNDEIDYDARWIFLSVPAYGLAVLAVDLATNHHTVLVARYLISILPCLALICAWLVTGRLFPYKALLALLIVGNLVGAVATARGERAPKQMLREAGAYIGERYSANDLVLVTPSGPTLIGLVRSLPPHANIAAAPPDQAFQIAHRVASVGGTVWLARQNLGTDKELRDEEISALSVEPVRFAGIDVIPVQGAQRP